MAYLHSTVPDALEGPLASAAWSPLSKRAQTLPCLAEVETALAVIHTTSPLQRKEMGKVKTSQLQLHANHLFTWRLSACSKTLVCVPCLCQGKRILLVSYFKAALTVTPSSCQGVPVIFLVCCWRTGLAPWRWPLQNTRNTKRFEMGVPESWRFAPSEQL